MGLRDLGFRVYGFKDFGFRGFRDLVMGLRVLRGFRG